MARILVVEDDFLIAFDTTCHLEQAGFTVIGPAASVSQALALLHAQSCDAAVLDVHLVGTETSEPIARELLARRTPFVTVTSCALDERPPAYDGAPLLTKPIRPGHLVAELRRCLSQVHAAGHRRPADACVDQPKRSTSPPATH
jgi:DNA-binding response OmpR family regulator